MNTTKKKIDPLTGGDYETELGVYVRYHGLPREIAEEIMAVTESYAARDQAFADAMESYIP